MGSCFAFFWKSMHKSVAFGKQLGTAAASCFSTILSSSSAIFNLFASLWWLKICRFPLGFSVLLKSGRFWLELCEEVMEDHIKNKNLKKQLGTAVPSCFFKVNHAMFSLFSSFFLPVSRFFIFSGSKQVVFLRENRRFLGSRKVVRKRKVKGPKMCFPRLPEAKSWNLSWQWTGSAVHVYKRYIKCL